MATVRLSIVALLLALGVHCASASTIQISPSYQNANSGQTISAVVQASGFVGGRAPSIGSYDLNVSFDPAVLSFVGVSFGTGLDVLGLGSIQSVTQSFGSIELFELSLDSISDLNTLQPDTFMLANLQFQALGNGTSALGLTTYAISDAAGNNLPVTLQGGTVQIGSPSAAVTPEPPGVLLCSTGLAMLIGVALSNRVFGNQQATQRQMM